MIPQQPVNKDRWDNDYFYKPICFAVTGEGIASAIAVALSQGSRINIEIVDAVLTSCLIRYGAAFLEHADVFYPRAKDKYDEALALAQQMFPQYFEGQNEEE